MALEDEVKLAIGWRCRHRERKAATRCIALDRQIGIKQRVCPGLRRSCACEARDNEVAACARTRDGTDRATIIEIPYLQICCLIFGTRDRKCYKGVIGTGDRRFCLGARTSCDP